MTTQGRTGPSWSSRLLVAVALILVGAAATAWALARYDQAARMLGGRFNRPGIETFTHRVWVLASD